MESHGYSSGQVLTANLITANKLVRDEGRDRISGIQSEQGN
jgi:hypothetical protein